MTLTTKLFNDYFEEFINFVVSIFPNDVDIQSTKTSVSLLRKNNPKLICNAWNEFVSKKYGDRINEGDINYFLDKDYSDDLQNNTNSTKIIEVIDRIRIQIKQMNPESLNTVLIYLKNLNAMSKSLS